MKKKLLISIISVTLVLILAVSGIAIYAMDYYRSDKAAIAAFSQSIDVERAILDGAIAFGSEDARTGFIFYPGGKVEYTSYEPLMLSLAQKGILCVLVEMPLNLAVLDVNAADGIRALYPEIEDWYLGGHSLGGSMAANHIASSTDKYNGLVLLGAYSTADLSNTDIDVLSIYGSEDGVMDREKFDKYRDKLPSDFYDVVIPGGNHAYFGMYGEQDGDGTASISTEEQILVTANSIYEIILRGARRCR